MSYFGSHSDAVGCIHEVEVSENTHSSSGSKIYAGHSKPGGAADAGASTPAGQVLMVGRLRAGIKKPKTRTDVLTRKYASTGTGPA